MSQFATTKLFFLLLNMNIQYGIHMSMREKYYIIIVTRVHFRQIAKLLLTSSERMKE